MFIGWEKEISKSLDIQVQAASKAQSQYSNQSTISLHSLPLLWTDVSKVSHSVPAYTECSKIAPS